MASNSICGTCRQSLRHQLHQTQHVQSPFRSRAANLVSTKTPRLFSTRHSLSAVQASPKPARKPVSSPAKEAPPEDVQPGSISTESAALSVAKELRKRASSVTETYIAYGVCERLLKECARQADYTIPQAKEKNVEIPKTKDGEDLGVGTGWWFDSEIALALPLLYML